MRMQPWSHLISKDEVVRLHHVGIDRYGKGEKVLPRDGCVEASIGAAWMAEQYNEEEEEDRTDGLRFAACLLVYLASNHCFSNGNKRAAWLASQRILLELGLSLDVSEQQAAQFVLDMVERHMEPEAVALWLAANVVEATAPDLNRVDER